MPAVLVRFSYLRKASRSLPLDINPVVHWYPKEPEKTSKTVIHLVPQRAQRFRLIHEENDVLTNEELPLAKAKLKDSKHACLFICVEYPLEVVHFVRDQEPGKELQVESKSKKYKWKEELQKI